MTDIERMMELRTVARAVASDLGLSRPERIEFADHLLGTECESWTNLNVEQLGLLCVGLNGARTFVGLLELRTQP